MSSGQPTASVAATTGPPPISMAAPPGTTAVPAAGHSAPVTDPGPVLSPVEMSTAIRDLSLAVANLWTYLQGPYAPPLLSQAATAPPPPPPPAAPAPSSSTAASHQGVPITQIRFPPSSSQLPTWLTAPVYTTAPAQPTVLHPAASPSTTTFGGFTGYADPYTGAGGHQFQGGPMVPNYSLPAVMSRHKGAVAVALHGQQPPRFTKLEFATYDGTIDPLNWLNQCDQFFRGQRTLVSDRTWIASYHLRGAV